jgi:hypothetical protein
MQVNPVMLLMMNTVTTGLIIILVMPRIKLDL